MGVILLRSGHGHSHGGLTGTWPLARASMVLNTQHTYVCVFLNRNGSYAATVMRLNVSQLLHMAPLVYISFFVQITPRMVAMGTVTAVVTDIHTGQKVRRKARKKPEAVFLVRDALPNQISKRPSCRCLCSWTLAYICMLFPNQSDAYKRISPTRTVFLFSCCCAVRRANASRRTQVHFLRSLCPLFMSWMYSVETLV